MEERGETQPLLSNEHMFENQSNGKKHLVDFDPIGDSENPLDWGNGYRWSMTLLLAFTAFTV